MKFKIKLIVGILASLTLFGCGGDEVGTGALDIIISGEQAAVIGFPFTQNGETVAFKDGWKLSFTKYLVSVGGITVKSAGETTESPSDRFIADLHKGDQTIAKLPGMSAKRWESFGFAIVPAAVGAKSLGAADADVAAMVAAGVTHWVEGSGTKGANTIPFSFALKIPTTNKDCTSGIDNKAGVIIRPNTTSKAQITFHVVHMFWDTLGTEEASIRFEAVAAAAGADKVVSWDDLATQPLAALKGIDGMPLKDEAGTLIIYNPGAVLLDAQNLQAFMKASTSTQGHLDGEGLCTVSSRN